MLLTDVIPFHCSIAVPSVSFYPISMHARTKPIQMPRALVRTRGAAGKCEHVCVRDGWFQAKKENMVH